MVMKFVERFRQPDEFKAMKDRQRMLSGLQRMHAVHLALADMEPKPTPQDEVIASNPDIIDIRSRHPEYKQPQRLTIDQINPEDYLNREVLMPSYVRIVPVEETSAHQTEIS